MSRMTVRGGAREASISAVVTRADGRVENLGTIAYWSKNPLRRLAFRARRFLKRIFSL